MKNNKSGFKTVGELIVALQAYPSDRLVYVQDKELLVFGVQLHDVAPEYNPPVIIECLDTDLNDEGEIKNKPVLILRSWKDKI